MDFLESHIFVFRRRIRLRAEEIRNSGHPKNDRGLTGARGGLLLAFGAAIAGREGLRRDAPCGIGNFLHANTVRERQITRGDNIMHYIMHNIMHDAMHDIMHNYYTQIPCGSDT